jgi:hypothetical protein
MVRRGGVTRRTIMTLAKEELAPSPRVPLSPQEVNSRFAKTLLPGVLVQPILIDNVAVRKVTKSRNRAVFPYRLRCPILRGVDPDEFLAVGFRIYVEQNIHVPSS